jgi:hypothetical protein
MTVPEEKAISRARERLVRAACVVRTAARVAVCMPIQPARPEAAAPQMKATAVCQPSAGTANMTAATMMTKRLSHLYSVFRKAIAPSWI